MTLKIPVFSILGFVNYQGGKATFPHLPLLEVTPFSCHVLITQTGRAYRPPESI